MEIKTAVWFHLIPVTMAIAKKTNTSGDVRKTQPLVTADGKANQCRNYENRHGSAPLKIWQSYNPVLTFLCIYLKDHKLADVGDTAVHEIVIVVAPFTMGKEWRQHRCPSMKEWIQKVRYTEWKFNLQLIIKSQYSWGNEWNERPLC